jgi:hypothetical protein
LLLKLPFPIRVIRGLVASLDDFVLTKPAY